MADTVTVKFLRNWSDLTEGKLFQTGQTRIIDKELAEHLASKGTVEIVKAKETKQ